MLEISTFRFAARLKRPACIVSAQCREWPVVEQILAWRPSAAASRKPEDASKARVVRSPRENLLREYLIKFSKVSFRATRWVSHSWLSAVSEPRLKNFLTDGSRIELEPPDALEQRAGAVGPSSPRKLNRTAGIVPLEERLTESGPPAPEPDAQERIPAAYKTPDRILDVYFQRSLVKSSSAAKGKRKGGGSKGKVDEEVHINEVEESLLEDSETSLPLVARCLVKWQDLGYEQCESPESTCSGMKVAVSTTDPLNRYLVSRRHMGSRSNARIRPRRILRLHHRIQKLPHLAPSLYPQPNTKRVRKARHAQSAFFQDVDHATGIRERWTIARFSNRGCELAPVWLAFPPAGHLGR